ncbi:MAG: asparagine synthase (glutamine-hydrolyzing) [Candidatus Acidiferrales bacterium]
MCGICGVIGREPAASAEAALRRMLAAILHRGPDEEGMLLAPSMALGSRRLSIIDLAGGSQPIWNESQTLAVLFNGEIYNFSQLRDELASLGHTFRTRSDTEVIVHAYETWAQDCVRHLHGMFAFALVEMPQGPNGRATRVFLARDPLGIKPLYYSVAGGAFLFASEVRALLASDCISARLAPDALSSYLLFGSVGEPMTLVEGVVSLPPGHSLFVEVSAPSRAPASRRYWSAAVARAESGAEPRSSDSPAGQIREFLDSAVRSHLVADVPVGVFLSSGIDSTAIAALAARARSGIHTFTVAFPDVEFSESEIARRTAAALRTEHSELQLSDSDMLARLEQAVASFDLPSLDGVNTWFVSWAAHQSGLKVALSGLGSDELFGGYSTFRATAQVTRLAAAARFFPRPLRSFVAGRLKNAKSLRGSPDAFRKAFASWLDPRLLPHPYFFTRSLFTPQTVASHLRDGSAWNGTAWFAWLAAAAAETRSLDSFTAVSWLELRSYLASTLLRDTDAMSMSHSLEVRVPFLDTPLVERVLSLPESAKRPSHRPKALLIEALGPLLPSEIVKQHKRTFTFPWENWLRGPLGERVAAGLSDWSPALAPHVGSNFAQSVWHDFLRGRTSWSRPWSLFVLNEWAKRHLRAGDSQGANRSSRRLGSSGEANAVSAT